MAAKPSIPKGTRDFSPVEMAKRNYIFNTIRDVFHLFGYQQIETPSMENLSTLMGKYGDEGDKLLFKIQNSGDYFNGITDEELLSRNAVKLASKFCEKGLRYDLTVPFARYVVMHRDEISFPFKRYQIQPVWRADRPQKGRYREFYQCDADVVGSNSLLNEVELVQMIDRVFGKFGVRVSIKINNRKILTGIAEIIGEADKIVDITVAIDKLDKIGLENVNAELASKGIPQEAIDKLQPIILLSGSNEEKLETLKTVLATSEAGLKGVEESEFILKTVSALGVKSEVELDLTLARGLNYYTGAIFEVKALDVQIGSISGGGRYDKMVTEYINDGEIYPAVGISFGLTSIYEILKNREIFQNTSDINFFIIPMNTGVESLRLADKLRSYGYNVEVEMKQRKLKKSLDFANRENIPYVIIIGEDEVTKNKVMVKDMVYGENFEISLDNPENVKVIGFILLQDKIREEAPDTLKYFKEQGVKVKIISGDNFKTVTSIARRAGLTDALGMDASLLTEDNICENVKKYDVFGRVKPEQKKMIVESLQKEGHVVAMTGDGVNDVLALKQSDCSIAVASGTDAAKNVSQLVLLDSNFSSLPKVVAEGRRTINNVERSASLLLIKTIFTSILVVICLFMKSEYFYLPIHLSLITSCTISIPSFILALEPNNERVKGNFILKVVSKSVPAALTVVFNVVMIVLFKDHFNIDANLASTLIVIMTGTTGFIFLFRLCKPFNTLRASLVTFLIALFIYILIFWYDFFDLSQITFNTILLYILFAIASVHIFDRLNTFVKYIVGKFDKESVC